jgi:hypothetical protein
MLMWQVDYIIYCNWQPGTLTTEEQGLYALAFSDSLSFTEIGKLTKILIGY